MGEWLGFPTEQHLDDVGTQRRHFSRALAAVQMRSPDEDAHIRQARAANDEMVAVFNVLAPVSGSTRDEVGARLLSGAERSVVAPIAKLSAGNRVDYQRAEAAAAAAERAGYRSQLLSSILGLAAVAAFALFAWRLVRRIENQNVELQLADVAKNEFISTVSHELRTPLTSMNGFVELLLDESGDPLTDEQRAFLGTVKRGSIRLEGLVNDLLLTAQLRAGRLDIKKATVDLVEIARQSVESAQASARHKGLVLSLAPAPHPIEIEADSIRVAQAVDNLVSNAVKFTPEGGGVNVSLARADGRVTLTVSDTGLGMTASDIERLFEPFFEPTLRRPGRFKEQASACRSSKQSSRRTTARSP